MKKKILFAASLAAVGATAAHAQSSVTLYGLIDTGITYVNKSSASTSTAGHSFIGTNDNVSQTSRWGLRGSEDLGGGLKAIFTLESGFSPSNGTLGNGGTLFGRQAFVGLAQNNVGALTLGRQYSFSTDIIGANYTAGALTPGGNYAYHINDIDQLTSSRINNAIKFSSANFSGLTFGAMYGFSNQAGAFAGAPTVGTAPNTTTGSSRTYSFGANYQNGPFGIGAAYTDIRFPGFMTSNPLAAGIANVGPSGTTGLGSKDLRTIGVGSRYALGQAMVWGNWTNTRLIPIAGGSSLVNNYELGVKYQFTPALMASVGDTYTRLSGGFAGKWNQVNTSVDYSLSKRTDVYVLAIYQKASGSNGGTPVQAQIGDNATSYFGTSGAGSSSQVATRIGIRHRF
jgi:predicted porin